jgi:hypothetical protein
VAVAVPEAGVLALGEGVPDAARDPLGDPVRSELAAADAVLLGPGLDDPGAARRLIHAVCEADGAPSCLVLDAFALGVLPGLDVTLPPSTVLSPNLEEAGILLGSEDGADNVAVRDVDGATGGGDDDDPDGLATAVAGIADRYGAVTTCFGEVGAPDGRSWRVPAGGPASAPPAAGTCSRARSPGCSLAAPTPRRRRSGRPTCTRAPATASRGASRRWGSSRASSATSSPACSRRPSDDPTDQAMRSGGE